MCKVNPDNTHHIKDHRLIVRKCSGKKRDSISGDEKGHGYKAVIIDFDTIRIEGPKGKDLQEALELLFEFTADKLRDFVRSYENMQFSHIEGEELRKDGGARIAVKQGKAMTVGKGEEVTDADATPQKSKLKRDRAESSKMTVFDVTPKKATLKKERARMPRA
ncbi:hypothetical protein BAUCODRAFT_119003 [Baudoinia panamericana UAMH 10762]|uniref:Uncharacterized protein n=1 Tax=Baudoinia panamericana (strain UAMH 10762) TaxID=717646 RepID=M2NAQ2_BAUPA|nr:uncharacterized protein BAUCODRAFT_119003 [Baudoinia panamericana UAMH 10762]EMD01309.1 hypothetical protein BAUCODRAFT_119003 [Baudoinia panamericana UAMH 10762]